MLSGKDSSALLCRRYGTAWNERLDRLGQERNISIRTCATDTTSLMVTIFYELVGNY